MNNPDKGTGQNGTNGAYEKSIWGGTCIPATNGTKGANGETDGTHGETGGSGGTPYPFTMHVDNFIFPNGGAMNIVSNGGKGGTGGPGGHGGNGDVGGNAGDTNGKIDEGYENKCVGKDKNCPPALGGEGGDGTTAGMGGKGGDGGDGGIIVIFYKNGNNINKVVGYVQAGGAGDPGEPGISGTGGKGGKNEIFPKGTPQTYAFKGKTPPSPGNMGGGKTGKAGSITLHQMT